MRSTVFLLINRKSFALDSFLNIVAFSTNNVKEHEDKKHNAKPYLSMKKQTRAFVSLRRSSVEESEHLNVGKRTDQIKPPPGSQSHLLDRHIMLNDF